MQEDKFSLLMCGMSHLPVFLEALHGSLVDEDIDHLLPIEECAPAAKAYVQAGKS